MKKVILFFPIIFFSFLSKSQDNPTIPPPIIEFVGDANFQKSLTSSNSIPANTGIGVIYIESLKERYKLLHSIEIGITVNVASTVDTIKTLYNASKKIQNTSDFGNSVLLPSNSGQAFGFSFKGYFTEKNNENQWNRGSSPVPLGGIVSGGYVSFTGSNRNWSDSSKAIKASTISFHIGLFHDFINITEMRKDYSIILGLGWTSRWIAGDISNKSKEELRNKILGSTATQFSGLEVSLGIRLKNIKVEVSIPFLSNKADVPGLSGIQPNTFIGFTGGFPLKLN